MTIIFIFQFSIFNLIMCGIAGFIGFKKDELIKQMSTDMVHRGPDGEGFYIAENVSLMSRRLAIIDRAGGDQPIYNEDKTIAVVYNGEIYNYQELKKELKEKGHIFSTKTDTEVIVHGYEEWGEKCFDKFNAMFGVALYDLKKKKLILARDHFWIKPLYYAILSDVIPSETRNPVKQKQETTTKSFTDVQDDRQKKVIFSSEIKPLLNSKIIEKIPNDRLIYRYLRYRIHDDQEETFFEGIYRLMPGEMMIITDDKIEKKMFTRLREELLETDVILKQPVTDVIPGKDPESMDSSVRWNDDKTAKSQYTSKAQLTKQEIEKFREKLTDAVQRRLVSEVPVGTCLSGGLDSSTVVAIVNKLLQEKVKEAESVGAKQNTFSAVFPGSTNDEEKYIDSLLKKLNKVDSHKVHPKPESFFEELEDFVKTQEEPTISTGPYAQYKVMEEAHKYVTVLLDGQGADEMMAGYLPYYFVYLRELKRNGNYSKLFAEVVNSKDVLSKYFLLKFWRKLGFKKDYHPHDLLKNDFVTKYKKEKFLVELDNIKKRLVQDIFSNSLQSLLRYEDRNSMHFSVEGRVPFLDFNLLRYLFTLSEEAIIKNGWNKFILRQSVKELLPEIIVNRRNKIGFTTPEYEWFMRMKNKIYSIFLSESFAKRKYFKQTEVVKAFESFIQGKTDDTMIFWRLLNLELWLRIFFDKKQNEGKKEKGFFDSNEGKNLEIKVNGKQYYRFPIKTDLFQKGDDFSEKISKYVNEFISRASHPERLAKDPVTSRPASAGDSSLLSDPRQVIAQNDMSKQNWFVVISEKIVAISQGRSYFIWDINPGFWANILSKFVKKTPYGIGLGSPWTMQIAINEVGLTRILLAAIASVVTKPIGMKGIFYQIAGREVAAIDGPTEYSLYPSNYSAKLGPKDPQKVAQEIDKAIKSLLSHSGERSGSSGQSPALWTVSRIDSGQARMTKETLNNFQGVVIIDANDLGRNVLGNSTNLKNKFVEEIFRDNPMGQADEQTPLVIVMNSN